MADTGHILVVDDDDRIRDLLKRYLIKEGHRVTTAAHAAAARRMLKTMTFDLAILDIMMPGEDGLSLLSAMRETIDTPVILLTARGMAEDRINGLKRGAEDYLAKTVRARRTLAACCGDPAPHSQGRPTGDY